VRRGKAGPTTLLAAERYKKYVEDRALRAYRRTERGFLGFSELVLDDSSHAYVLVGTPVKARARYNVSQKDRSVRLKRVEPTSDDTALLQGVISRERPWAPPGTTLTFLPVPS
jgi:hypothetical protein